MMDFALLGEAVSRATGRSDSEFLADYEAIRQEDIQKTLEGEPVFLAALDFLEANPAGFSGTVQGLLNTLKRYRPEDCGFPRTPKGMGDVLTRIIPNMKQLGYEVEKESARRKDGFHCILRRGNAAW